jgi:hypothetical protein
MDQFRDWVQLIVPSLNLFLILFGVVKVFNRNEQEWKDKERRLAVTESNISNLQAFGLDIAAMKTKLAEIGSELERVRNRLDKFLDMHAAREKEG